MQHIKDTMMIEHFLQKLFEALSTVWGWLLCTVLLLMNFIVGYEKMVGFTAMAVVLDAAWGIAASLMQKRFALSGLARDTFAKLAVYGTAVFIFILIDKLMGVGSGLTTSVICIRMEHGRQYADLLPKHAFLEDSEEGTGGRDCK